MTIFIHYIWAFFGLLALTVGEVIFRSKRRQYNTCPVCDFDPYLYSKDITQARLRVQTKVQQHKDDQLKQSTKLSSPSIPSPPPT